MTSNDWNEDSERNSALEKTLEAFLASEEFPESLAKATRASWSGSGYAIELFEDGTWRVLWTGEIGNKYESPGVILRLPTLDDDGLQAYLDLDGVGGEEGYFSLVYANDEDELKNELRERFAQ